MRLWASFSRVLAGATILSGSALIGADARADVVAGYGAAYGLDSTLAFASNATISIPNPICIRTISCGGFISVPAATVNLSQGPAPSASAASPTPFAVTPPASAQSLADVFSAGASVLSLASDVDGSPGTRTTTAVSVLAGLSVTVPGLLTFSATTLTSVSSAAGEVGALTGAGATLITGGVLNGAPLPDGPLPPDDVVFDAGGLVVELNVQALSGDGVSSVQQIIDALAIHFDGVPYTDSQYPAYPGYLTGQLSAGVTIAGEAAASVPEASGGLVMGAGLAALAFCARPALRRRRASAPKPV